MTWSVLFNTSNGWVNYFFGLVGLPQLNWAGGSHTAMPTVLIATAWTGIPIIAIILLAGLVALPKEPSRPPPSTAHRLCESSGISPCRACGP